MQTKGLHFHQIVLGESAKPTFYIETSLPNMGLESKRTITEDIWNWVQASNVKTASLSGTNCLKTDEQN